jgi:hypothetical protein
VARRWRSYGECPSERAPLSWQSAVRERAYGETGGTILKASRRASSSLGSHMPVGLDEIRLESTRLGGACCRRNAPGAGVAGPMQPKLSPCSAQRSGVPARGRKMIASASLRHGRSAQSSRWCSSATCFHRVARPLAAFQPGSPQCCRHLGIINIGHQKDSGRSCRTASRSNVNSLPCGMTTAGAASLRLDSCSLHAHRPARSRASSLAILAGA